MKRVATAVVLIPLVLLAIFRAPIWLLALVVLLVALLTTREYLGIVKAYGLVPFRRTVYAFVLLCFAAACTLLVLASSLGIADTEAAYVLFLVAIVVFVGGAAMLVLAMRQDDLAKALPSAAASFLALPYITVPLVGVVSLRGAAAGWFTVLYLLAVVWVGDACAYYVGRAIGRHKLAPRISPGKSWEGAVASFVGAVAVGSLMGHFAQSIVAFLVRVHFVAESKTPPISLLTVLLLSAGINLAAQFGDLVESMMKRGAGVKDSGALLPGHGGLLDRVDALLFAAPVLWYYAAIVAAANG